MRTRRRFTGQNPFPDDVVLLTEDVVAAVKEFVELVVGIAESREAKLPQAHVLERAVGVLPRHQPVGTDHQKKARARENVLVNRKARRELQLVQFIYGYGPFQPHPPLFSRTRPFTAAA